MDDGGQRYDDLTAQEVRVLGCLVEKEATVPDTYPMTLNSLRTACNQSTSRDPVVSYRDHEIETALTSLRARGLTRVVHSTSNRATKYKHVLPETLSLGKAETALLSVLMLRGAQTVGELKSRTDRQHKFKTPDDVATVLERLAARPQPLALELPRQPGQKDTRWVHLMTPIDQQAGSGPGTGSDGAVRAATRVVTPARDAPPDGVSGYAVIAEFSDLLVGDLWDTIGLVLLDVFEGLEPTAGPIVDVGAGTGVGLAAIHEAAPGMRLVAIEPSPGMRTALHARLHDGRDLIARTSVVPSRFGEAQLPDRAAAVVAIGVLGHLDDAERSKLWHYVATSLRPGAPAVIGLVAPTRPVVIPGVRVGERRVGQHLVEGWSSTGPLDERSIVWTQRFRIADANGLTLREASATVAWRCDGVDDVRAEIAPHGLALTEHDGCVVVRRRGG
jgi:uncharacterized protein YceH (UPF0502 family)